MVGVANPAPRQACARRNGGRRGEQHTGNVSSLAEIASGSCSVSVSALVSCVPKPRGLLVETTVTALRSDISSRMY